MFYAVPYHILAVIEQRIDEFLEHLEDTPELRKELTSKDGELYLKLAEGEEVIA